jgi:hypothetical protein
MKIHLETLKDFQGAMTQAMDGVKDLVTEDMDEKDQQGYLEGEFDELVLTLTTLRMKRDYTFSNELKDIIGRDDALFDE